MFATIMTFLNPVGAFLKGIPWQLYLVAAVLALLPVSYCKGKSAGKQVIIERLEKAEAKAKADAAKAAASADEKQQERATDFQKEQEALGKAIDDARANDENALDAIF